MHFYTTTTFISTMVKAIESYEEFQQVIKNGKTVVIDFCESRILPQLRPPAQPDAIVSTCLC